MKGIHICRFSSLDDLPKRRHGDSDAVLAALMTAQRFCCFEVTPALGRTLERLRSRGRVVFDGGDYPWTGVREATDAERERLRAEAEHLAWLIHEQRPQRRPRKTHPISVNP